MIAVYETEISAVEVAEVAFESALVIMVTDFESYAVTIAKEVEIEDAGIRVVHE